MANYTSLNDIFNNPLSDGLNSAYIGSYAITDYNINILKGFSFNK
jgi:hypothetical protein